MISGYCAFSKKCHWRNLQTREHTLQKEITKDNNWPDDNWNLATTEVWIKTKWCIKKMTMRRLQVKIKKRKKLLAFSYIWGKPVKSLATNSS